MENHIVIFNKHNLNLIYKNYDMVVFSEDVDKCFMLLNNLKAYSKHFHKFNISNISKLTCDDLIPDFRNENAKKICDIIKKDIDSVCCAFGRENFDFRIELLDSPSCVLFHKDNVECRVIKTYLGPGTQWVTRDNVNWDYCNATKDDVNLDSFEIINTKTIKDLKKIYTAPTGSIMAMRGSKLSNTPFIHRSNPNCNSENKRFVLIIDI